MPQRMTKLGCHSLSTMAVDFVSYLTRRKWGHLPESREQAIYKILRTPMRKKMFLFSKRISCKTYSKKRTIQLRSLFLWFENRLLIRKNSDRDRNLNAKLFNDNCDYFGKQHVLLNTSKKIINSGKPLSSSCVKSFDGKLTKVQFTLSTNIHDR
ncbi:uncharacterized protein LOC129748852 [Uranotaenia lowii]|nr:uncharacterized protein LOC129748852 [Uranotaenia lowii]